MTAFLISPHIVHNDGCEIVQDMCETRRQFRAHLSNGRFKEQNRNLSTDYCKYQQYKTLITVVTNNSIRISGDTTLSSARYNMYRVSGDSEQLLHVHRTMFGEYCSAGNTVRRAGVMLADQT